MRTKSARCRSVKGHTYILDLGNLPSIPWLLASLLIVAPTGAQTPPVQFGFMLPLKKPLLMTQKGIDYVCQSQTAQQ